MEWTDREWEEAISSVDWASRVIEALGQLIAEDHRFNGVALISTYLELPGDGNSYVRAVYDHPSALGRRIGLRRQLNHIPLTVPPNLSPEESLADEIATIDIGEPLGRYWNLLVEDDSGVWWWGDGFPQLQTMPTVPCH